MLARFSVPILELDPKWRSMSALPCYLSLKVYLDYWQQFS
jgi:hypothetical protein